MLDDKIRVEMGARDSGAELEQMETFGTMATILSSQMAGNIHKY